MSKVSAGAEAGARAGARYVIKRMLKGSVWISGGDIQKFPGLIGFFRSVRFQIPRQDSRFHLLFQANCTRFQLVSDPSVIMLYIEKFTFRDCSGFLQIRSHITIAVD